jgi:PAS domain S-box-containing protein
MSFPTFTILMVEDFAADRELYRRSLEAASDCVYELLEADSVAAGLELCQTRSIDAILLDYLLPDGDGLDFLTELSVQSNGRIPPVVMMTGHGNENTAVRAIKLGAEDYLVKRDLTPERLQSKVRKSIENARLRQQQQQQKQRFIASVENMLDCFGIYSAIRDQSEQIIDFRFDYLNTAAMQANRMTADDIGRTVCDVFPAFRATGLFAEHCQVVETGVPLIKDNLVYSDVFGGEQLTIAYNAQITKLDDGFVASWRDVTAQKQVELSLQVANQQITTIWESMTDAYVTLDHDWRIVYTNPAATAVYHQTTGRVPAEYLGENHWEVFPCTVGTMIDREYRRAVAEQVAVNFELFYEPTETWFELHAYPSAQGLGIYFRDINQRKLDELARSAAERERDRFFDLSLDLLIVADLEGHFVRVNPACDRILGFTSAELMAQPYLEFVHPDDREHTVAAAKSMSAGNALISFENRYRCKDGSYRWILWSAIPDLDLELIYADGHDITDRKVAELNDQFLYELAHRLRQLTDAEAIEWEAVKSLGEYLDVDRATWFEVDLERGLATVDRDWHRAGLVSHAGVYPIDDFILPEQQATLSDGSAVAIADVTIDSFTASQIAIYQQLAIGAFVNIPCINEGRWVATLNLNTTTPRNWHGYEIQLLQTVVTQLCSIVAQARGVEALRAQEQQTRAAQAIVEQQLREIEAIYQSAPVGLCFVDTDLRFVRLNERLAEINGLPVAAHIGRTISEILPSGDQLERLYRQVIESGEPIFDLELSGTGPAQPGVTIYCLVRYYPQKDAQGRVVGVNAMVQDITDRKRHQAALEARNQELDAFVFVASHDLKAPLRAVANLSEWIEEELEGQLTADTQLQMNLLRSRVNRMSSTIDGLLQYARSGRSEDAVEPVAMAQLLADVVDEVAPPSTFTIDWPAALPILSTKRMPLFQIFVNLVGNGIKHHHAETGSVRIAIEERGDWYQFAIADDGPGIAPEHQARMFEIFQAVNPQNRLDSTGIGLAIVKKIIEAEGGTIWLESEIGNGTTFYFTWPKGSGRPDTSNLGTK